MIVTITPHNREVKPLTDTETLLCGRGFGKTWTGFSHFMESIGFDVSLEYENACGLCNECIETGRTRCDACIEKAIDNVCKK